MLLVCVNGQGTFVVEYTNTGDWTASLVNGSVNGLQINELCSGTGMGENSVVAFADLFPISYDAGFFEFSMVLTNNTQTQDSVSLYAFDVAVDRTPPLCYDARWLCNPQDVSGNGWEVVGIAQTAANTTVVSFNAKTQQVQFTLLMSIESGGCYTEVLNTVENVRTSAPYVDIFEGQGQYSTIISVVDTLALSALMFTDAGVLFQVIDLTGQGYSKVWAAKFNGNSEPTLSVLAETTSGMVEVAEMPLSLSWGTSGQVTIPFAITENQYQASLDGFLGYVLAPLGSSTIYAVNFGGTVSFALGTTQFFLLSAIQSYQPNFGQGAKENK